MTTSRERVDALVIGGGISGLTAAERLARPLARTGEVVLLEATGRLGGLVRTEHVESPVPLRFEAGPESLLLSPAIEALAGELGLPLREAPASARRRWVVHRGRLVEVPTGPAALLRTPLLSPLGKLRLLGEPLRSSRKCLDGSVADFFRHRLGPEALEALVDPFLAGIHAGDPEQLSARACFPRVVAGVETHGSLLAALRARRPRPGHLARPADGMEALPRALERRLGNRVRLGSEVTALTREGERYVVRTTGAVLEAPRLVLALPVGPTARLLGGVAPDAARALSDMRCEDLVSVLVLLRREEVEHPLDGFGYLVPRREGRQHLGTLFCSSIDPEVVPRGHVLLRVLCGGARRPELARAPEERLLALVSAEVAPLLGLRGSPEWSAVWRHPGALPRFDLEHPARLQRLERGLPGGLTVLGNFTRGIGLAALIEEARGVAGAELPG